MRYVSIHYQMSRAGGAGEDSCFKGFIPSDVTKVVSNLESLSWARASLTKTEIARKASSQQKSSCSLKIERWRGEVGQENLRAGSAPTPTLESSEWQRVCEPLKV